MLINLFFKKQWACPVALLSRDFSLKSDVWSFGIVLWEIFSGAQEPYYNFTEIDQLVTFLQNGGRLTMPLHCPLPIYNLMLKCWVKSTFFFQRFSG